MDSIPSETKMNANGPSKSLPSIEQLGIPLFESVKWVGSSWPAEKMGEQYNSARRLNILMIILAPLELFLLSVVLFISQLPWPQWCLDIIYKIDAFIVTLLDAAVNTLEKFIETSLAFVRRFSSIVENAFDFFFSLWLFVTYKVFLLATSIFNFWLRVFKTVFYPWIKIAEFVIVKLKINLPDTTSAIPNVAAAIVSDETEGEEQPNSPTVNKVQVNQTPKNISPQSDFESESESSIAMGLTDKTGQTYMRVDTNLTPEGRLREEMYKHVKTQLRVMRKGSVKFSRDMASYAKNYIEPKLSPLQDWILKIAKELGLISLYKMLEHEIMMRPYLAKPITLIISLCLYPLSILTKWTQDAKRSRRSRSSRTESLKRRAATSSPTPSPPAPLGSSALRLSAEPAVQETTLYDISLEKPNLPKVIEDEEGNAVERDSALASSLDDLNLDDETSPDRVLNKSIQSDGMDSVSEKNCEKKSRKRGTNVSFVE